MATVKHLGWSGPEAGNLRRAEVAGRNVYLSTDSSVPFYVQIAQQLTYLIYSRQLAPGAALPSVRTLAADLGVTSNTISQAYSELRVTGLAASVKGSGTYVRHDVFIQDEDWHIRNELASDAVAQARWRMHSLGLSDEDLQRHVMGVLHSPDRVLEVAFVAPSLESAEKFARAIDEEFGHHGVRASPLQFDELEDPQGATAELLKRVYYLVTFVSTRVAVEKLIEPLGRRHRVIGISLELVRETVESLRSLDPYLKVVIVTTDRYLDISLNVVQSNSRLDPKRISRVSVEANGRALKQHVEKADLVIYTFGAKKAVEKLGIPEDRRLLINFRMDDASKGHLAAILGTTVRA